MYPISSSLTSQVQDFAAFRDAAAESGFALGGNWDYGHGSFDCSLDEANKVWLRLPFQTAHGRVDSESPENDAKIRFGEPFVLKHIYNEGLDGEATPRTYGALLDQFSDPVDADAGLEPGWIDAAKRKLAEIEAKFPA